MMSMLKYDEHRSWLQALETYQGARRKTWETRERKRFHNSIISTVLLVDGRSSPSLISASQFGYERTSESLRDRQVGGQARAIYSDVAIRLTLLTDRILPRTEQLLFINHVFGSIWLPILGIIILPKGLIVRQSVCFAISLVDLIRLLLGFGI